LGGAEIVKRSKSRAVKTASIKMEVSKMKIVKSLFRCMLAVVFAVSVAAPSLFAADSKDLDLGKWDSNTRAQIQKVIDENGNKSPNYDAKKKPYAVFDWDQTCIFNDTEEALFRYMLANILFKATPKSFSAAIRKDVPKDNFGKDYNNKAGQPVNVDLVAADLDSDYQYLYDNYIKSKKQTLAQIKQTPQFLDWQAKLAYLYEAIGSTFSADVSYPWVLYLFADMTVAEVKAVSEASNDVALGDKIGTYTLTSPDSLPGKAGVVSLGGYKWGLRVAPEMSNLMNVLRANGIDVYVCSASHEAVVQVFAGLAKYGYNVPAANVIGMKTKIKGGKYQAEYDYSNNYPQTQGKGKTTAITQILVKKYGYDPIFIASDSSGDYNMATEFAGTKLTLMINRLYANTYGKLGLEAYASYQKKTTPRYVLQGRNENTGQFRPSMATIKMGKTEADAIVLNATIDPNVKK
jgi:phosphoserine phosphatase